MSWILVEWSKEGDRSVIPASWVVSPQDISAVKFPVDGIAYWKKPSKKYDARLLASSDTWDNWCICSQLTS